MNSVIRGDHRPGDDAGEAAEGPSFSEALADGLDARGLGRWTLVLGLAGAGLVAGTVSMVRPGNEGLAACFGVVAALVVVAAVAPVRPLAPPRRPCARRPGAGREPDRAGAPQRLGPARRRSEAGGGGAAPVVVL